MLYKAYSGTGVDFFVRGCVVKRTAKQDFMLAGQLEQVIANRIGRRQLEFIRLAQVWKEVVGKRAAAHTMPAWIKKDVLWGYVDSSSWMQELAFMKPKILQQVNQHLRSVIIVDIRWLRKPLVGVSSSEEQYFQPNRDIDPEREEEFRSMTGIIADPGCQQALFHLWRTFQKKMR